MRNFNSLFLYWIFWIITLEASTAARGVMMRCSPIQLENGKVRIKSRGRVAKFKCRKGYLMFEGDRFATCVRGTWIGKIPKCISSGCQYHHSIPHGEAVYLYNDALVQFLCFPGYSLQGSPALTCDGDVWNDTLPVCQAPVNAALSCDFEDADVCGWMNDEVDHFDWTRNQGPATSFGAGTGPKVDHTLGTAAGHYMYVDASQQQQDGDTARLFSPVYQASLTEPPACFAFYFHMFGNTTGNLNVYVQSEHERINFIPPILQMSEYHNDKWILHVVHLHEKDSNFQIILEAVRGIGYMSDIAIDDVQLAQGDDCDRLDREADSQYDNVLILPTRGSPVETTTRRHTTVKQQTTSPQNTGRPTTTNPVTLLQTTAMSQSSRVLTTSIQMTTDSSVPDSRTIIHTSVDGSGDGLTTMLTTVPKPGQTDETTHTTEGSADTTHLEESPKTEAVLTTVPKTEQSSETSQVTTEFPVQTTEPNSEETNDDDEHKQEDLTSCKNRCGEIAMEKNICGCDIMCYKNTTCCSDIQEFCPEHIPTPNPTKTVTLTTGSGQTSTPQITTDSTEPSNTTISEAATTIESLTDAIIVCTPSTIEPDASLPTTMPEKSTITTDKSVIISSGTTETQKQTPTTKTIPTTTAKPNAKTTNIKTTVFLTTIAMTSKPTGITSPKPTTSSPVPIKISASTTSPSSGGSSGANVRVSKSTVFIAIGVAAAIILLLAIVVAYIRKRRRDKLPEDSDIRFLARDELMMEGNVFSLTGTFREARNTAI